MKKIIRNFKNLIRKAEKPYVYFTTEEFEKYLISFDDPEKTRQDRYENLFQKMKLISTKLPEGKTENSVIEKAIKRLATAFHNVLKKLDLYPQPKIEVEETARSYPTLDIQGEGTGEDFSKEIWVIENGAARLVDSIETAEREYIRAAFIAGVKGTERPSFAVLVKVKKNKEGIRYDA